MAGTEAHRRVHRVWADQDGWFLSDRQHGQQASHLGDLLDQRSRAEMGL
ncbi:MAG: hypothetical protein VKL00_06385 [Synechococcales bacterium]|nr:hypothetical protein [Synechococcales bacterium]